MRADSRLGFAITTAASVNEILDLAVIAEEKGFESIWVSEDPYLRDLFPIVSLLGRVTKRVKICTGIANYYSKNPVYMAMTAATVDEICGGRFVLGLGRNLKSIIEGQLGITYGSPLRLLEEYIQVLKRLWMGEEVTFHGKMLNLNNAQLRFTPVRDNIPIYVAAMGPKTLRLVGKIADGVYLNGCSSPEYVRYAISQIKLGADEVGRNLNSIDVACGIGISISDEDSVTAFEDSRKFIAFFLSILSFGELILNQNGHDRTILVPIRKALESGNMKRAAGYISDFLVDRLTVSGSIKECKRKIDEFRRAGVKLPILLSISNFLYGKNSALPLRLV